MSTVEILKGAAVLAFVDAVEMLQDDKTGMVATVRENEAQKLLLLQQPSYEAVLSENPDMTWPLLDADVGDKENQTDLDTATNVQRQLLLQHKMQHDEPPPLKVEEIQEDTIFPHLPPLLLQQLLPTGSIHWLH